MTYYCQFCSYCCSRWDQLMRHTFESHSSEPNFSFTCGIDGCRQTFNKYSSIKSHISRKHRGLERVGILSGTDENTSIVTSSTNFDDDLDSTGDGVDVSVDRACTTDTQSRLTRSAALFLITLKEKYALTQSATDFAVGQVKELMMYMLEDLKSSVDSALQEFSLETGSEVPDLAHCYENINPFLHLETEHMQKKFYKENFNLVEPVTVELGSTMEVVHTGAKRRLRECKDTFQYVPLLQGLKALLQSQEILDEVLSPHSRSDGFIADHCDGQLFKSHPLFQYEPNALQIITYFDEMEVSNPIGAHRGIHKLGMFYYTLGNFRPQLRSTQQAVQLIACVSCSNLQKYGFGPVLEPFIQDANTLYEEGVTISISGHDQVIHGSVLLALADTLGAHQLGGFKVGVGFALRKCRECMATTEDMQTKFVETDFKLRDPTSYDHQCSLLQGPLAAADSTTYGLNCQSPLNQIQGFHVANSQLPQDIMHVLFEGVIPKEMKLMLNAFMSKKYITLQMLNNRIKNFTYGRNEYRNKVPKDFTADNFTDSGKLPLSASQAWNFAVYLPLMIGDKIPEEEPLWECYLLLLEITKYCTARVTSPAAAAYITALVDQHHREFKSCYPHVPLTPKMHYMTHFPGQMLKTGPLITCWCMRMEAKHKYFKKVARIGNFKNVSYSVAHHHQRLMCAILQGKFFTYDDLQCGPCKLSDITALREDAVKEDILAVLPQTDPATMVSRPNWISIYGEEYHISDFLQYSWQENDLPWFVKIKDIIVVGDCPLIAVDSYQTEGINNHLSAYLISSTHEKFIINPSQLQNTQPLYAHTYIGDRGLYIAMRAHVENVFS